jgi:hypothetical protein
MMTLTELRNTLQADPSAIEFNDVIQLIDQLYHYTPTDFTNGLGSDCVINKAGTNEGSCRLFAFALAQQLSTQETLACFGRYYREDVLNKPEGNDHSNIRNFIKYGWEGISFSGSALQAK